MRLTSIVSVALLASLQGCAFLTTYKSDLQSPSTGVSVDAKQRFLLVNDVPPKPKEGGPLPAGAIPQRRMCAEPSPDALSVLGATFGAQILSSSGAEQKLTAALGESASSIGLRTTSIQLMRDAMYRACEAYLSGGLSEGSYRELQAHSQTLIVGLLAIEQLTGAVQSKQVAITSSAGSESGGDISQVSRDYVAEQAKTVALRSQLSTDEAQVATLTTQVKGKQSELDAEADATKKTALQTELDDLKAKLVTATTSVTAAKSNLSNQELAEEAALNVLKAAQGRLASGVTTDARFSRVTNGGLSDAGTASVANAVTSIVTTVAALGIERNFCIDTMLKPEFSNASAEAKTAIIQMCYQSSNEAYLRQIATYSLARSESAFRSLAQPDVPAPESGQGAPKPDSQVSPAADSKQPIQADKGAKGEKGKGAEKQRGTPVPAKDKTVAPQPHIPAKIEVSNEALRRVQEASRRVQESTILLNKGLLEPASAPKGSPPPSAPATSQAPPPTASAAVATPSAPVSP